MQSMWVKQVKDFIDSVASYTILTFLIFIGFAVNAHAWFNWPSWQFWSLFLIEFLGFCWWINWATGPSAIRDRTKELEDEFSPKPHHKQWARFDAIMKRWEENERERDSYDD